MPTVPPGPTSPTSCPPGGRASLGRVSPRAVAALTAAALSAAVSPGAAAPALQLYGTFQSMGVIVTLARADDPDRSAIASVEYRPAGSGEYRRGFPLSRVTADRFVGSLFWLEPGTTYEVRVRFSDRGGTLDGRSVEGRAATREEPFIPEPWHTFHVAPDGGGTACSRAEPCALRSAVDMARAGDEIRLAGGVYYEGEISLPRSGKAGAPIVLRSREGERAILDGADPGPSSWQSQGGGIYRSSVAVPDPHVVMAGTTRLFPYGSLSDLRQLTAGVPGFYASGTTLYVRLAGAIHPRDAGLVVSRYNFAFLVEQDFICFLDLTFRHYGQGEYAKAIYLSSASDTVIRRCTFAWNDVGVGIKRASNRNVIEDSEFYDAIGSWSWDAVKDTGGLEDGGVYFYETVTGRGNVVRRNTFHDDFDGFHVCPAAAALTNETDVYENHVYNMVDDGLETDGRCSNVRIWSNVFHDVLMGISLAPAGIGPVYAMRNLIYRTGSGGRPGSAFKFNSDEGPSGPMFLFHNTADAAREGMSGLYVMEPGSWPVVYGRNNVWLGAAYALLNENPGERLDFDYDDLWSATDGQLVWWEGLRDRDLNSLDRLRAATGQEARGLNVLPAFVDRPAGDYRLLPGSALVDRGVVLPGINDGYAGKTPDLGAFETAPVPPGVAAPPVSKPRRPRP
jgi:hypothetical protein